MRTYDAGEPLGGRTFRFELEMRSPLEDLSPRGCRGLSLQTWEGGFERACQPVALTRDWNLYTLDWTVPETSGAHILRLVLNDFNGLSYDMRRMSLYEKQQDTWIRVEPLRQESVSIGFETSGDSRPKPVEILPLTSEWQKFTLFVSDLKGSKQITAHLSVGSSQAEQITIALRNTRFRTSYGQRLKPSLTHKRAQLWFSHPNLAAHTVLSVGLVALSVSRSTRSLLLIYGVTGVLLLSTGSRAALLAFALGMTGYLWLSYRKKRWVATLVLVSLAAGAGLSLTDQFDTGLLSREGASRFEIWRLAGEAFLNEPWRGVDFPTYWQTAYQGASTELVTHAHNLWLHFASSYGSLGLIAILWLTVGFFYIAWIWGRWRGLALVIPIFIMNLFDVTLFHTGVLLPLIFGLNVLRVIRAPHLPKSLPSEE